MAIAATLACAAALASFSWGILRFFVVRSAVTWRTRLVAAAGLSLAVWDLFAVWRTVASEFAIGLAIAGHLLSLVVFWSAVRVYGAWRPTAIFETDVPCTLVTHGPYRLIRHPFYASYTVFWFANGLASGSSVALAGAGMMFGVYLQACCVEEQKFEASPLAAAYREYRRDAGRFLPRVPWRRFGNSR